ncbi:hypothetical protein Tsubulata_037936, partial [Turnera subulata]
MGASNLLRLLSRCLQQLPPLKPLLISTLAAAHLRSTEYHRLRMAMISGHKRVVVGIVNGTGCCIVILVAWNWCFGRVMNCSRDVGCVEGCVNSTGRNPARFRQPREFFGELGND